MLSLLLWLQPSESGVTFIDLVDPEPERSVAWFILRIFALIGVALLITMGVGAGAGFLRIWIMRRFPHNRLNGVEDEALTRLHLNDGPEDLRSPP